MTPDSAIRHLDEARALLETARHCAGDCPTVTGEPAPRSVADYWRLQALRAADEHLEQAHKLIRDEWTSEDRAALVRAGAEAWMYGGGSRRVA
jgi:hypothetical protein